MKALDTQLRHAFWRHMITRYPDEAPYTPLNRDFMRWHPVAGDLYLSLTISVLSVAIFVRAVLGGAASGVERVLLPHRDQLEAQFGVAMYDKAKADGFFTRRRTIDMKDQANWNMASDFLWYNSQLYERALGDLLGSKP